MTVLLVLLFLMWIIGVRIGYSLVNKIERRGLADFEVHAAILGWPVTMLFIMAGRKKNLTNNPET